MRGVTKRSSLAVGDRVGTYRIIAHLVGHTYRAIDVGLSTKGQRPELNVELNRGLAGSRGITVGQIAQ